MANETLLFIRVARSQLGGQPQRLSLIASSLQPAMFGATALYCGKSCPMERGLTGRCPIRMWVAATSLWQDFLPWEEVKHVGNRWQNIAWKWSPECVHACWESSLSSTKRHYWKSARAFWWDQWSGKSVVKVLQAIGLLLLSKFTL